MERIMENNTIIEPGKTLTGKPHFMKIGKIFLVLDVCVLYAMQAFVFFPFYGILKQKNYGDFNWPVIGIFLVLSFVIGLLAFVFAIIGSVAYADKRSFKPVPYVKYSFCCDYRCLPDICIYADNGSS